MNRTVYIRDEDIEIWDRAKELAGELSPVIVDALRAFIRKKESEPTGEKSFKRIEVRFDDSAANDLPCAKAFIGRWIIPKEKPYEAYDMDGMYGSAGAVAITAKGNVVVHGWEVSTDDNDVSYRHDYWLQVYPDFETAAGDKRAKFLVREAVRRMGVAVEELDI